MNLTTFLDFRGLATFFNGLKNLFATKDSVTQIETDTNMYVIDVDPNLLEFDKDALIEESDN